MKHITMTGMIVVALIFATLPGCSTKEVRPFDVALWDFQGDILFAPPYRDAMLADLWTRYTLVGMHTAEVIQLLGEPEVTRGMSMYYEIVIDYGWDIDPQYVKNLRIQMSVDSTITSAEVEEWERGVRLRRGG